MNTMMLKRGRGAHPRLPGHHLYSLRRLSRPTQRYRWRNAEGLSDAEKKKRTLTNLYNARPTWLDLAHKRLDEAVFAAYGWKSDLPSRRIC